MAKIEIYTIARCPYCIRGKALLDRKGIAYVEIHIDQEIDQESKKRDEMIKRSEGRRTVPQIFINNQSVGGFDELWILEQKGELDALLK